MLKISLITLAVIGVLAVVGIAWARHNGYCAGGDYLDHVTTRISRKLDLDEEQNGKLQGVAGLMRELRGGWAERRSQVGDEVGSLLAAPAFDRDRVLDLLAERQGAMAGHAREIVDAFADFSDSLQPDQRARLSDLIVQRMQHRWGPPGWAH